MTDRRLRDVELPRQITHTRLAGSVRGDQREQPQAYRVAEGLEHRRQLARRNLAERFTYQRRTEHHRAKLDHRAPIDHYRYRSLLILTIIDAERKLGVDLKEKPHVQSPARPARVRPRRLHCRLPH